MDHAINDLKEHLNGFIEVNKDATRLEVATEVIAYVSAIRTLEQQYYGEAKTGFSEVIFNFKED